MGELERALREHRCIGVDTAPFVYLWERHPDYYPLAEELFRHLSSPQVRGVTSIITLIEACVYPSRRGRLDLVQAYEGALLHSQQVTLLPIDTALARRAVVLRAKYDVRVPDALQIAAALQSEATLFVTNDHRLAKVREIDVLLLGSYVT